MQTTIKTELIENYLKENNLSKTKFCKICKISYSTYKKIMSSDNNFGVIALFRIAKILNIEVYKMFNN